MKKCLLSSLIVLAAVCLCGCLHVPATKVKGELGGKPFELESPKNVNMTDFSLTAKTNGDVTLKIGLLGSTNSSDVIQTTGAAEVAKIKAYGDVISQAFAAGAQAFASGGASLALQEAVKAKAASVPAVPSVTATNK